MPSATSTQSRRTTNSSRRTGPTRTTSTPWASPRAACSQDCCKDQYEVNLFGGQVGNYEGNVGTFDGGCVDRAFIWCDNLSNNDPAVLTFMSRAFANMVVKMAFDNTIMSSSTNTVYKKTLPIAGETSRALPAY
jgi:hypothetical protein